MKTTSTIRNLITRKIAELGIQTQIENEYEDFPAEISFEYFSIILKRKLNIKFTMFNFYTLRNDILKKNASLIGIIGIHPRSNSFHSRDEEQKHDRRPMKERLSLEKYKLRNYVSEKSAIRIMMDEETIYMESFSQLSGNTIYYNSIMHSNSALIKETMIAIAHYFKEIDNPTVIAEVMAMNEKMNQTQLNPAFIEAEMNSGKTSSGTPYWKKQQESYNRQQRQRDSGIFAGWF